MSTFKKLSVLALAVIMLLPVLALSGCGTARPTADFITKDIVDKINFVDEGPPLATVGVPYSFSFASETNPSGGHPPYSFTLGSAVGFPPMGLILDMNGLLSGTPKTPGDYKFEVVVKDLDGNTASVIVMVIVEPAPEGATEEELEEDSELPGAYVYSGTLNFTIKEQYIPTYANRGFGFIDNASDENQMSATVNFSEFRLTPSWNPNQEDFMRGQGYFREDFEFYGSIIVPDDNINAQDTFSGSFDDFAIFAEYIVSGKTGEKGILITFINPTDKEFPTVMNQYWDSHGGPQDMNNLFNNCTYSPPSDPLLFFSLSGGTVNFSDNGFLNGNENNPFDYSGTLTLTLTQTE